MHDWTGTQWLIFALPFAALIVGFLLWMLKRKDIRTRVQMDAQLKADPDINDWLVIFNWSRKIIYLPTIILSMVCFLASVLGFGEGVLGALGTIWLFLFLFNFIVEEFSIGVKEVLIVILFGGGACVWLAFLGWLRPFVHAVGTLSVTMNGLGYLMIALVFSIAIAVSWFRGLFHYVAVTPNSINIQSGLTETGVQISREDYNTQVDTSDILERMMGFGRIVVNFRDLRRAPVDCMVWNIGRKSRILETIRGTLTVDRAKKQA
jgi:hypothetical protein